MAEAAVIRQIIERIIKVLPTIKPRTEADLFVFRVWEGGSPLDQVNMPTLMRAFRVGLGETLTPRCNSNSSVAFHRAVLEIAIGYPLHLINAEEASRAGIEVQIAEDVTDIKDALVRRRLARLSEIGPVRSLISLKTRRTPRTVIVPFDLEWGQPR